MPIFHLLQGPGIAINTMAINETFCVTGSDDGFMRLWPLDFAHVYLEAEHEGPVTAVGFSADGLKIVAGTALVLDLWHIVLKKCYCMLFSKYVIENGRFLNLSSCNL